MVAGNLGIQSLVWATDIDVLPPDREVVRRDGYWVVRSPSNPGHYWGNLLIFDRPPQAGDRSDWLDLSAVELPGLAHRTFAWDVVDGSVGAAEAEFPEFELERTVGLVAAPADLSPHPRANADVVVERLGADDPRWEQVLGIWVAMNAEREDPHPAEHYRNFAETRLANLRKLFRAGRGGWFVALDGDLVVGSLGVVVTGGRARYQSVDTKASHRRRGIASRLVIEAAARTSEAFAVDSLVIAADPDYHALGIYESLGFRRAELVSGVCQWATRTDQ